MKLLTLHTCLKWKSSEFINNSLPACFQVRNHYCKRSRIHPLHHIWHENLFSSFQIILCHVSSINCTADMIGMQSHSQNLNAGNNYCKVEHVDFVFNHSIIWWKFICSNTTKNAVASIGFAFNNAWKSWPTTFNLCHIIEETDIF